MTREFKFRFWDEEMKDYWDWEEIQNDWESDGYFDTAFRQDHWTCEQFTGLYDKNGKEIYEGDILKTLDGSICFVIWSGTSFWLESPGSEAKDWEYNSFYEHCEVIGNIHENKELLND
jgi:hypothetical protein